MGSAREESAELLRSGYDSNNPFCATPTATAKALPLLLWTVAAVGTGELEVPLDEADVLDPIGTVEEEVATDVRTVDGAIGEEEEEEVKEEGCADLAY